MYPKITHIDDVIPYIEDNDDFYIADKGDYKVINYKSIMAAFPDLSEGEHAYMLRELRGIIFCGQTGNILRRPLHKFFNYGERSEGQPQILDAKRIVGVYDKLDGSMISPFKVNGQIIFGTKMGATHMMEDVHSFVDRNPKYLEFTEYCLERGVTPIFEYMSPKHRIVVDYRNENMVLLAIRDTVSGAYFPYDAIVVMASWFKVNVVRRWEINDHKSLIDQVRNLRGAEGVVIEYDDGMRVKVKSLEYVDLHRNREMIAKERYVAGLVLNDRIDDVMSLVPEHVRPRLEVYAREFVMAYEQLLVNITNKLLAIFTESLTRKEFAMRTDLSQQERWIGFKVFDEAPETKAALISQYLKDIFLRACNSDIDFTTTVRNNLLKGLLPEWNIWEDTASIDE